MKAQTKRKRHFNWKRITSLLLALIVATSGYTPVRAEGNGNNNLALHKACSYSVGTSDNNRRIQATDGNYTDPHNYADPGGNDGGAHWMQVDLGDVYNVGEIKLYRHWEDGRKYRDTVVMISSDEKFAPSETLVLWNANSSDDNVWPGDGYGQIGNHRLPAGDEEDYVEESSGKRLVVENNGANYFKAQYVRVYMNGNYDGEFTGEVDRPQNHIVELQVYEQTEIIDPVEEPEEVEEEFITPEDVEVSGENIAPGKRVTYSVGTSDRNREGQAIDKNKADAHNYADPGGNTGGAHWMQLDLEDNYDIKFVKLYRHWLDDRAYNDTVILVSAEEDFAPEKTIVLWNANRGVATWSGEGPDIPVGTQKNYIETENGLALAVSGNLTTLDEKTVNVPDAGFTGRYVRVYMNGNYNYNAAGEKVERAQNHIVELEVYGEPAQEEEVSDAVYPERVESLTPLSNLAKGFPVFLDNGTHQASEENTNRKLGNIVNGDKYDDSVSDSKESSVYVGDSKYITVDLGESFPIEVINIKRDLKKTFTGTAIVLANKADFSDGEVLYYQDSARDNLTDFDLTNKQPATTYAETYGGNWFYMGDDATVATPAGTVKSARYVRIYSTNPANDTTSGFVEVQVYGYQKEDRIKYAGDYSRRNREISPSSPLFIHSIYSNSLSTQNLAQLGANNRNVIEKKYFDVNDKDALPVFKHEDTIKGRWNAIPKTQKNNSVILVHTDNLGMAPGTQINASDNSIMISQEMYQEFYERSFAEGYKNDIPMMMVAITASAVPLGTKDADGTLYHKTNGRATSYNLCFAADLGWTDLMYRMYPNFEGTFNPENHWSHNERAVAAASGMALEMAGLHNGYFIWSESAEAMESGNNVKGCQRWTDAIQKYGSDHLYMMFKTTGARGNEHSATSYMQGMWLGGYAAGWGGLIDTWTWADSGMGAYGANNGYNGWKGVAAQPEATTGSMMLSMYLEGASVYTHEHPIVTNGADDKTTPMFDHVISELYDYFVENPGPSKAEILDKTKFIVYGNIYRNTIFNGLTSDNSLHTGKAANKNANYFLYDTGRYGAIPAVTNYPFASKAEIAQRINAYCAAYNVDAPALIDLNDPLIAGDNKFGVFKSAYAKEYSGDGFADLYDGKWFAYHSEANPEGAEREAKDEENGAKVPTQTVKVSLTDGDNKSPRLTATMYPSSYVIADETVKDGSINVYVNTYRVRKDGLYNNGSNWGAGSGAGQEYKDITFSGGQFAMDSKTTNVEGKPWTYPNAQRWNTGLWEYVKAYTANPLDRDMRKTVITLNKLSQAPTVTIVDAQEWDGEKSPQIMGIAEKADNWKSKDDPANGSAPDEVQVDYNESNGTATITLYSNGWTDLKISGLQFEVNTAAEDLSKEKEITPEADAMTNPNVAKSATVVMPSYTTDRQRPLSYTNDGNKDSANYVQTAQGPNYVQLELEEMTSVEGVGLWRYSGYTYDDTIILLSPDNSFSADNTLVLYNAMDQNVTWPDLAIDQKSSFGGVYANHNNYAETNQGKKFKVESGMKFLNKNDVQLNEDGTFNAKYVRIYSNGQATNNRSNNHFVEVEVYGKKVVRFKNLTSGANVEVSNNPSSDRPASRVVDGNKDKNQYMQTATGAQWIQIKLASMSNINSINMWRYWDNSRMYKDVAILISPDEFFKPENTLVLYNSVASERNWATKSGFATVNLPLKDTLGYDDSPYLETADGKSFTVTKAGLKLLNGDDASSKIVEDTFEGRYIRIYSGGLTTDANANNHFSEVEVIGAAGRATDESAPMGPFDVAVANLENNSSKLTFTSATDNIGIDHYEVKLVERLNPSNVKETKNDLTSNNYTFNNLSEGIEYEMTIVAVDKSGNKGDVVTTTFTYAQPPIAPSSLSVYNGKLGKAVLNINMPADNTASAYRVLLKTKTSNEKASKIVYSGSISDTSCEFSRLISGTNYTVSVWAINSVGQPSAIVNYDFTYSDMAY